MRPRLALPALILLACLPTVAQRPPAVPLVTHDPYFSVWSLSDQLNSDVTRHWTGKPNSLTSLARIDGKTFRLMGAERGSPIAPLPQQELKVSATQTVYRFTGAGVEVALTFTSPLL